MLATVDEAHDAGMVKAATDLNLAGETSLVVRILPESAPHELDGHRLVGVQSALGHGFVAALAENVDQSVSEVG